MYICVCFFFPRSYSAWLSLRCLRPEWYEVRFQISIFPPGRRNVLQCLRFRLATVQHCSSEWMVPSSTWMWHLPPSYCRIHDASLQVSSLRCNIIFLRHLFLDFRDGAVVFSPVEYFLFQLSDLQLLRPLSVGRSFFVNLWPGHVICSKELYVSYLTPLCSSPNVISTKSDRITILVLPHVWCFQ